MSHVRQQATSDRAAEDRRLLTYLLEQEGIAPSTQPPIGRRPASGDPPLSFAQQRLWFLRQLEPDSPAYNMPLALRLTGTLDVATLKRALEEIVRRHETLRTSFTTERGAPSQVIAPDIRLPFSLHDLRDRPGAESAVEAGRIARDEIQRPFDLAAGPQVRCALVRLAVAEHVLVITIHHIISDGWSLGVLNRELTALYAAFIAGEPSPLSPLRIQYADFAHWQREWLRGPELERQVGYWRRQLADTPTLELPTDRPRPPRQTHTGAVEVAHIPEDVTRQLRAFSQREGVTLAISLLAVFKALLQRYSGQDDIAVGSPIANRTRSELEDLIGFFVNSLVMRTNLAGDPTVRELLGRVRTTALAAYEHQDLPFEQLVQELQPERDLSRHPLFQVMFAVQNAPADELTLPGLSVRPFVFDFTVTTRFDLEAHVWDRDAGLQLVFYYNPDLFDHATVRRMVGHYGRLLEQVAADPERRVSELSLLTAEEVSQIDQWHTNPRPYPRDATLAALFEVQVAQTPDAVAVAFEGETLSYRELNARANRLAHYLRRRGVGPEQLVGLCVERGLDMVVGILGIVKAGGAYVPLDPEYPAARLAFMLADTQAAVVLTQQRWAARFATGGADVVVLDAEWSQVAEESPANPVNRSRAEHLAYVMYTSGSTGRPKGVSVEQRGVVRLVMNTDYVELGPEDVFLQFAPIAFDASTFELWGSLLHGAKLVVAPARQISLAELTALIERERVSVLWLTAAVFHRVVEHHLDRLRHVRQLLAGGEALSVPHVERALAALSEEQRLINGYGPTENTTFTCCHVMTRESRVGATVPIGRPIANTRVHVLDAHRQDVPVGVPGELYIGGDGVAREYWRQPSLTAERFLTDPERGRLYRTGDVGRYLADGALEFLGRRDQQVKLRGYRIELGEIEAVLREHPTVHEAVVLMREDEPGDKRLVAYLAADPDVRWDEVRSLLRDRLPAYMVPSAFVPLRQLPLNASGKVDRAALPPPRGGPQSDQAPVPPRTALEERIAKVWREVLRVEQVSIQDNFFDVGGHSLLLLELGAKLVEELGRDLPIVELFAHPTIESLARMLEGTETERAVASEAQARIRKRAPTASHDPIAIVGMAGRFPGARDVAAFWANLREGRESIQVFSDAELRAAGVPDSLLQDPKYVRARGVMEDPDAFDAAFFGYSPREAELTDPQQRILLECAWEALERSAYDPERYRGLIGVFAGGGGNGYLANLESHPDVMALSGMQVFIGTNRDFLATRVSYKLNLRGPSINIQTACSTSLVAVHAACQSLRDGDCDLALAGGVSIAVPVVQGYVYQEDGILSPDGHCRAFDAQARGTVGGSGVGVVVLQRLSDALRDGAVIHAVIRGTAINNDGSLKVGYTAPSVQGQATAIALAQAAAGVDPGTIGYVETHGTGTALGDPIEVEALTRAFGRRGGTSRCALGSLKSNVGHLDAAAGVAALIKATLCLEHRELVPSLHFEHPNPRIDFRSGPFYVVTERRPWTASDAGPRRAGVSSFGIGGTNAHAVLEEAPALTASSGSRPWQVLTLCSKSARALDAAAARLAGDLKQHPARALSDVAYTLQVGRREFVQHRRVVVARDVNGAVEALEGRAPGRLWSGRAFPTHRGVVFMFPGQGSQYPDMGRGLYDREPVYRDVVDACAERAKAALGFDVRDAMHPDGGASEAAAANLRQTLAAQVSLFAVDLGLARLWMSWGITPTACIGHSIGEYVAACLSEVLSVEDALKLVLLRGRLMDQAPPGAMLAVPLAEEQARRWLHDGLWLSAVNSRSACVVSGVPQCVDELEQRLRGEGVECRRLHTSGAFHSGLMSGVMQPLTEAARRLCLGAPKIPYISNVTGTWVDGDAKDPAYWSRHLREPVRFDQGVGELLAFGARVFLEVGPGHVLTTLVTQRVGGGKDGDVLAVPSLRHASEQAADHETMARALGRLWLAGVTPDWDAYYAGERRRRVELPTYPFERERYWIQPNKPEAPEPSSEKRPDVSDWFYLPLWKETPPPQPAAEPSDRRTWLVFTDPHGAGNDVAARLESGGQAVVRVGIGDQFRQLGPDRYDLDPAAASGYQTLLEALASSGRSPTHIVHAWSVTDDRAPASSPERVEQALNLGFYSLLHLLQALRPGSRQEALCATVITNHVHYVTGDEVTHPAKAAVLGLCRVARQEYPNLRCANIDLTWPPHDAHRRQDVVAQLADELLSASRDPVVAYRGTTRWIQDFAPVRLGPAASPSSMLRERGVYLITGGLGGVAFALATYLARTVKANLVLVGRTRVPPRAEWNQWLETHHEADGTSVRIRRVEALERLGGHVMVAQADVADVEQLRAALVEGEKRFGLLHGLIHAAGVTHGDTFKTLDHLGRTDCERQFRAKVHGTAALARVLEDRSLDFCLFTSSLSTVLGGLEFGAYAAANSVMDGLAQQRARCTRTRWISVDWDGWQLDPAAAHRAAAAGSARFSMTDEQGAEAFSRILALHRAPRVVVSTGDLAARIARSAGPRAGNAGEAVPSPTRTGSHPRPDLRAACVAPRDDIEATIASLWQEMLGISQVGVDDNFFELGGDSLIAVHLLFRLSAALQVDLRVQLLFDAPTVAELAEIVRTARRKQQADAATLAEVLAMVEGLSDEEVRRASAENGLPLDGEPA